VRARLSLERQLPVLYQSWHERLVALVERMLELNKKKHSVPQSGIAPSELDRLERHIASTDREIDECVYELYGITQDQVSPAAAYGPPILMAGDQS